MLAVLLDASNVSRITRQLVDVINAEAVRETPDVGFKSYAAVRYALACACVSFVNGGSTVPVPPPLDHTNAAIAASPDCAGVPDTPGPVDDPLAITETSNVFTFAQSTPIKSRSTIVPDADMVTVSDVVKAAVLPFAT